MRILYFAWLRTQIGCAEEDIKLPDDVKTVGGVIAHLRNQGPAYARALGPDKVIRVALNQDYAQDDNLVKDSDEFAIFPPVTGG